MTTHAGALSRGKKIPEMNNRGKIVALAMGGADSVLGMTAVRARPRAPNHAAPSSTVTIAAGIACQTT